MAKLTIDSQEVISIYDVDIIPHQRIFDSFTLCLSINSPRSNMGEAFLQMTLPEAEELLSDLKEMIG